MNISSLQEIIGKYDYSQANILDRDQLLIRYNSDQKTVGIDNFYRHGSRTRQGSCSELMIDLFLELQESQRDYHILRVAGKEPTFFNTPNAIHCFLLLARQDLLDERAWTSDQTEIERVLSPSSQELLVVDPSFQRVVPYSKSGYHAQTLFNENYRIGCPVSLALEDLRRVPLCFDRSGRMVQLVINFASPYLLDLAFHSPHGDLSFYRADEDNLGTDDPLVLRFQELILNSQRLKTTDRLEMKWEVFI